MSDRPTVQYPDGFKDPKLPSGYFSNSQYSCYKKCGDAYYRRYILKQRTSANPNMVRGTAIHAGVERMLKQVMDGNPVSLQAAADEAVTLLYKMASDVEDWGDTSLDEVAGVVRGSIRAFYNAAIIGPEKVRPIASEKHFAVKVGGVPMAGYIDYIDKVEGIGPVIVDLKTGTKKWSDAQLEKSPQLTLYAALEGHQHVRVDQLLERKATKTRLTSTIEYSRKCDTRSDHDFEVLKEDLQDTVRLIKLGVFPKAPIDSWGCSEKWCDHWKDCRGKSRD